jgi:predicted ATPase
MAIHSIEINRFKSIRKAQITLNPINILIGSNGVGKSNFIGFFKLINEIYEQRLKSFAQKSGNIDSLLYFGRKISSELGGAIDFKDENDKFFTIYSEI